MELQANACTDGIVLVSSSKKLKVATCATDNDAARMPSPTESTGPMIESHSPRSPSKTGSKSDDFIGEVLNLSFPRCSCCNTGWYDAVERDRGDDDAFESVNGKSKRKRHRDRPSACELIAMPKCACITQLALPCLPSSILSKEDCEDPSDVLSQIQIHSFPNLAICRSCLKQRIAASKEVTVHDYRQEHIPNGQRNVKFTVEPDCVQCKRKFMGRMLERLLESEESLSTYTIGGSKKRKAKPGANWGDAVEATIQLVGWAKRNSRRERRRVRRQRTEENVTRGNTKGRDCWWENHSGFTGGDDNCSSDECFSVSSCSSDEWESGDEPRAAKGPHHVELQPGELLENLRESNTKLWREIVDRKYVDKMLEEEKSNEAAKAREDEMYAKKLMENEEKEEQKVKAARAQEAQKDHEIAMVLQEQLDKQHKSEPPKSTSKTSPLMNAWKKTPSPSNTLDTKHTSGSSKKSERKQPHAVDSRTTKKSPIITALKNLDRKQSSVGASSAGISLGNSSINLSDSPARSSGLDETTRQAVSDMVSMGFRKAKALRCLKKANGNVEEALNMLLEAPDHDK